MKHVWSESEFLWLTPITEKWEQIRDYALSKENKFNPYKAAEVHNGLWLIYGLRNTLNKWLMPDHTMDPIFNLLPFKPFIAAFSCLNPGAEIYPHEGYTTDIIRFHLGLKCSSSSIMILGENEYTWKEGKWFIFNDMITHSVKNTGTEKRFVLLMDFYRKDIGLDY